MRTYIRTWLVAGAVATGAVLLVAPARLDDVRGGLLTIAALLLVTAAAEMVELRLTYGRGVRAVTLLEAAVVADIVLLPPGWALLTVLSGMAAAQAVRGREARKIAFNTAQIGVSTAVALVVYHLVRAGSDPLSLPAVGGLVAGMVLFVVINVGAIAGIMTYLAERPFGALAREIAPLSGAQVVGNTAVGLLAAVLWTLRPELVPLVAAPAVAVHLAYLGSVRSSQLLDEVRTERDRIDRVVQAASDGIVLLAANGTVEVWSPAMTELTGIPADEAIGRSLRDVLVARDPDGQPTDPLTPLAEATPDQPGVSAELVVAHRRGDERVVGARHTVLFDARGNVTGDVVLLQDITRQREVERLKDDFIARASHELRTPLTPIRGFAEVLLRRGDDVPADLREVSLRQIVDHAQRMTRLVDDLLVVSQTGAGLPAGDLSRTDLRAVCDRVAKDLDEQHPDRMVEVLEADGVPPALADPAWVERIVTNLLSNACKFSPAGSPVTVAIAPDGDRHVCLRVTDRGRGVPPDQLERIFDRFHRVEDPLTMTTRGLGLGLYLARQLARRMGGEIRVESTLGAGSTFTLTLPAADD